MRFANSPVLRICVFAVLTGVLPVACGDNSGSSSSTGTGPAAAAEQAAPVPAAEPATGAAPAGPAPQTQPAAAANPAPTATNLAKSAAESMAGAQVSARPTAAGKTARIRTNGAVLYKAPSTKSAKLASDLRAGETVTVLERQYGSSEEEIILYHPMPAYASAARSGEPVLTLPSGSEVTIERFDKAGETYYVHYRHPEKGMLYGTVTASQLETLNYTYWYRIRRANGQEGWAPGKYIE